MRIPKYEFASISPLEPESAAATAAAAKATTAAEAAAARLLKHMHVLDHKATSLRRRYKHTRSVLFQQFCLLPYTFQA